MDDILQRAEYYQVRAHRKARAHYLAAKRAARKHTLLGVPVVILSTIVGGTIFASISEDPAVGWKIVTGMLSVTAAVLAALQTFFKFSEMAEKHRVSGAENASLKRRFDTFILRMAETSGDREEALAVLESIIAVLDQLEKESLDVPDQLYDQAVDEHVKDEDGI